MPTGAVRGGRLGLVVITAGATNNMTAVIYDNASAASGTVLANLAVVQGWTTYVDYNLVLPFSKGLFVVVAGTGANLQVTWD